MIIKGILTRGTAREAFVSVPMALSYPNHGGRQLDGVLVHHPRPAAIADAVKGQIKILVDSGIRTGLDILFQHDGPRRRLQPCSAEPFSSTPLATAGEKRRRQPC